MQQQQQTMAFGTPPVGAYPGYVMAGPVPNNFQAQMNGTNMDAFSRSNPYLTVNPQQQMSNPNKSPPTSSAPSQPMFNHYAQTPQGMAMATSNGAIYAQIAAVQNQAGQPSANWAEFIPSNQVPLSNGIHKNEGKPKEISLN
jgi:hypothetical protein